MGREGWEVEGEGGWWESEVVRKVKVEGAEWQRYI